MEYEYTSLIHKTNGQNITMEFVNPKRFMLSMKDAREYVVWARLFESKTGIEVASFEGGTE